MRDEIILTEPWADLPEGERLMAMEQSRLIIFSDRSAVRLEDNIWVKDDRYDPENISKSEAGQFLADIFETAARHVGSIADDR
jgi:hypothetical protein